MNKNIDNSSEYSKNLLSKPGLLNKKYSSATNVVDKTRPQKSSSSNTKLSLARFKMSNISIS